MSLLALPHFSAATLSFPECVLFLFAQPCAALPACLSLVPFSLPPPLPLTHSLTHSVTRSLLSPLSLARLSVCRSDRLPVCLSSLGDPSSLLPCQLSCQSRLLTPPLSPSTPRHIPFPPLLLHLLAISSRLSDSALSRSPSFDLSLFVCSISSHPLAAYTVQHQSVGPSVSQSVSHLASPLSPALSCRFRYGLSSILPTSLYHLPCLSISPFHYCAGFAHGHLTGSACPAYSTQPPISFLPPSLRVRLWRSSHTLTPRLRHVIRA